MSSGYAWRIRPSALKAFPGGKMERNLVLAIILTFLLIMGGTFLINRNRAEEPIEPSADSEATELESGGEEEKPTEEILYSFTSEILTSEQDYPIEKIVEETDLFRITFSTVGGVALDIELLKENDKGQPVSMVLDGNREIGTFNVSFGNHDAEYIDSTFSHERIRKGKEIIHKFSRDFLKDGQQFSLTKTYRLLPGEYVIELIIILETLNGKAVPLLDGEKSAYTLTYGPQIGPSFEKIDGRYEIRNNVAWGPDPKSGRLKRRVFRESIRLFRRRNLAGGSKFFQSSDTVKWVGVVGKYFAVIVDPGSGASTITWDNNPVESQPEASRLQISKPARRQSVIEDIYKFYIGPLDKKNLNRYNSAEGNAFGIAGMGLQNAPRRSALFSWLEAILKWLLELFYVIVPNYGVAIILLTFLIKALFFPLTHKSYESTSKMQAIQPKMAELREQYKKDPKKLNTKTAELYKQEGVNPLGGCLPILLQIPIFIALYNLLNNYFPLRGSIFILGWIDDLSAPEAIVQFSKGITFFGAEFDAIRLLPILYLLGQLLTTKVTQAGYAGSQSGSQQKILAFGMPIFFFFILYNFPSGLLLYWSTMNFITIGQQLITNYVKKRKRLGSKK